MNINNHNINQISKHWEKRTQFQVLRLPVRIWEHSKGLVLKYSLNKKKPFLWFKTFCYYCSMITYINISKSTYFFLNQPTEQILYLPRLLKFLQCIVKRFNVFLFDIGFSKWLGLCQQGKISFLFCFSTVFSYILI